MTKPILTMNLPKVGDKLMRIMTDYSCEYDTIPLPKPCVVVYVNERHGWYQVEFLDNHIKECYGLPVCDHGVIKFDVRGCNGDPVVCVETATVYRSISECARAIGVPRSSVYAQLMGVYDNVNGYHFVEIL